MTTAFASVTSAEGDIGLLPQARPVASASLAAPPPEDSMLIGGASPERVAIPELGVTPPDDSGTDWEDELLNQSPPSCHLSRNLLRHFWGAFGMKLMCPSCDTSRAIAHALWRL